MIIINIVNIIIIIIIFIMVINDNKHQLMMTIKPNNAVSVISYSY